MPPRLNARPGRRASTMPASSSVVGRERHLGALADVEVGARAPGARQPRVEVGEVGGRGLGDEARAQPAVGDLPGEPQHPRRERGQVDRDVRERRAGQPHRPALAARERDRDRLPRVDDLLTRQRHPHDLDGLAQPRARPPERHPVQAFDHLRAGRAEPEQEPAAGQLGQRARGLGHRDRAAGADLDHAGAEQHPPGAPGEPAERGRRVGPPGFGDPADVQAQPLGLQREVERAGPGRLDGGGGAHHLSLSVRCQPRPPAAIDTGSHLRHVASRFS